ncbi:MAG: DUF1553 domain-containing protein [Gemmataceae bacterium]
MMIQLPLLLALALPGQNAAPLSVTPASLTLLGKGDRQQLLVNLRVEGRPVDRTRQARYRSENPAIASVSPDGVVTSAGNGSTNIVAEVEGQSVRVAVQVRQADQYLDATFERDVIPILTRAGCNGGPCHGKARGQNGFQLSLLGFDPDFDFNAIVNDARGRRLFPSSPEQSLFLRKGAAQVPHGGGKRLVPGDPSYELLLRWIAAGTPRTPAAAPRVERITIEPSERQLGFNAEQQLAVTAIYSDGSRADVTHLATFQSSESTVVAVNADGLAKSGPLPGEAAIMARFMEKFAICNVLIPQPGKVADEVYARLPRHNFIDGLVWDKLRQLNLTPSEPATEATFLRRVYLDVIGRLPTPEETQTYLADTRQDRRQRLIDGLLRRPEYADYWANKWADLLRPNPYRVGIKAVFNLDAWLRESFRENKPYDRFVREILTARGSTFRQGPVTVFRDRREPDEITTMVSQLFLGIRLECAKCHHHPFEIWGQNDFYSLAAYFARMGRKGVGLSPPISGSEEVVFPATNGEVKHPLTNKVLPPRPLFGTGGEIGDRDPREALADWVVSKENPFFARVIVNRVWADLMGRGLVEPVDDMRATNPPTNGPLLDALAADFRKNGHDLKKLIRTITTSYVYSLSSLPNERNVADTRNYSRHYRQRLRAEVLLDAVSDITGVPEAFSAMPAQSRAMELWTVRTQSLFLDSFGRPDPNQDPPCERSTDTTVVQVLHLMNAPGLHQKVISDRGRAARLASGPKSAAEIVDELYALVYSRKPSDEERALCLKEFERKGTTRRRATEDLLWALLNTPEFLFKD